MKRTVYYVISASAEENQNGTFHYSRSFNDLYSALGMYEDTHNDFISIEKHQEVYRNHDWHVNWDDFPDNAIELVHPL